MVFDVDYNTFRAFKKFDATFFWSEEEDRFVLVKVANNINVRCVVLKDSEDKNDMFKIRELFNYSGIFCKKISTDFELKEVNVPQSVFDVNDVKIVSKNVELKKKGK